MGMSAGIPQKLFETFRASQPQLPDAVLWQMAVDAARLTQARKPAAKKKTQRRAAGDGSLFKRADGMWIGSVEIHTGDGRRRQRRVYSRNQTECRRKLDELRRALAAGYVPASDKWTVERWLTYWLDEVKRPSGIRPNTIDWYDQSIRLHLAPTLGKKKLRTLTPEDVRQALKKVDTTGNAVRAHRVLKTALKDAIAEGLVMRNVMDAVAKPEHKQRERTALTVADARKALKAAIELQDSDPAELRLASRWAAALLTGARPGELTGLTWDRVDFDNDVLDLSWQIQQVDRAHGCGEQVEGEWPCGNKKPSSCPSTRWNVPVNFVYRECRGSFLFTRPKTSSGVRIVPMVAPLREMLLVHRAETQGEDAQGLVWTDRNGGPLRDVVDAAHWYRVLKHAKLPKVEPYTTRHTCATLLLELGIDESTRMAIMGQSSAAAHAAYLHVSQDQSRAALSKLVGALEL